jgi:acetyl-CoA C-acetyltransferase
MKSNLRAAAAIAAGRLADEIVPVAVPQRKGDPVMVTDDEGVRAETTMDSLGGLKPAFDKAWQDKMREISGTKEPQRRPK